MCNNKFNGVFIMIICEGKIIDGVLTGIKESVKNPTNINEAEFSELVAELEDCLLLVEGEETSTYDDSDDDRAGCYWSQSSFKHYYEIGLRENSKHLLRIDGKIRGVVFFVRSGYSDVTYKPFLFDNSIENSMNLGHSASHSSDYTNVKKVSLVKKGEGNAPQSAKVIDFSQSEMYPNI